MDDLGNKKPTADGSMSQGRLDQILIPHRPTELREAPLADLSGEILARIQEGAFVANDATILLGSQIQTALQIALDVHLNRVSRKRYRDLFYTYYESLGPSRPALERARIVDLGCGSINPFGFLFLFLMLGAHRGIAIDLDPIQDLSRSVRILADCAAMMLIDATQLVGDYPIPREQILKNIASFDLAKMNAGDPSGIDEERLSHRQDSLVALSLGDGVADLVMSHSVLEHIESVDRAIAEMARITRKGGLGVHFIDGSDHRRWRNAACHPLEFLAMEDHHVIVHGSNRVRPLEFGPLFERQGFEVLAFDSFETIEVGATQCNGFAEPFRSMSNEVLAVIMGKFVVRRL